MTKTVFEGGHFENYVRVNVYWLLEEEISITLINNIEIIERFFAFSLSLLFELPESV